MGDTWLLCVDVLLNLSNPTNLVCQECCVRLTKLLYYQCNFRQEMESWDIVARDSQTMEIFWIIEVVE